MYDARSLTANAAEVVAHVAVEVGVASEIEVLKSPAAEPARGALVRTDTELCTTHHCG